MDPNHPNVLLSGLKVQLLEVFFELIFFRPQHCERALHDLSLKGILIDCLLLDLDHLKEPFLVCLLGLQRRDFKLKIVDCSLCLRDTSYPVQQSLAHLGMLVFPECVVFVPQILPLHVRRAACGIIWLARQRPDMIPLLCRRRKIVTQGDHFGIFQKLFLDKMFLLVGQL